MIGPFILYGGHFVILVLLWVMAVCSTYMMMREQKLLATFLTGTILLLTYAYVGACTWMINYAEVWNF